MSMALASWRRQRIDRSRQPRAVAEMFDWKGEVARRGRERLAHQFRMGQKEGSKLLLIPGPRCRSLRRGTWPLEGAMSPRMLGVISVFPLP
jgi:hypothetical protein